MNPLRLLRIVVIAVVLPALFQVSQQIARRGGDEPVAGVAWAVGALGVLFLLRAVATEYSQGSDADFRKDLQWGLAGGCLLIVLSSLH